MVNSVQKMTIRNCHQYKKTIFFTIMWGFVLVRQQTVDKNSTFENNSRCRSLLLPSVLVCGWQ